MVHPRLRVALPRLPAALPRLRAPALLPGLAAVAGLAPVAQLAEVAVAEVAEVAELAAGLAGDSVAVHVAVPRPRLRAVPLAVPRPRLRAGPRLRPVAWVGAGVVALAVVSPAPTPRYPGALSLQVAATLPPSHQRPARLALATANFPGSTTD